jgi:hypothetical protein
MRKIYLFGIVLLLVMINSCELNTNNDPNYPTDVKSDKFFASGLMWTASVIGGDLQLLGGIWSQHYAQNSASNQYTNIDSYNLPNSNAYITRTWSALYAGALTDFQQSMVKAETNGDWHYWMTSKIMTAYVFHLLADAYGNIPFSQALKFEEFVNPVFDDSKTINANLITMLNDALAKSTEASDAAAASPMGSTDLVFKGDMDMWVKFAKSLKLKILMRDPV